MNLNHAKILMSCSNTKVAVLTAGTRSKRQVLCPSTPRSLAFSADSFQKIRKVVLALFYAVLSE